MLENMNNMLRSISDVKQRIREIKQRGQSLNVIATNRSRSEETDSSSFASELGKQRLQEGGDLNEVLSRVAKNEGVDEDLVRSVMKVESGFDQSAVSDAGAIGLMQLLPSTAELLGVNPNDPKQNIKGGVKYLGQMLDRFDSLDKALAAYNAGPAKVEQYDGIPPYPETQNYVKRVTELFRQSK